MNRIEWFGIVLAVMVASAGVSLASAGREDPPPPDHAKRIERGRETFKKHVRTVLVEHCTKCHGDGKLEAKLDLTSREGLIKGGDNGAAVVPFKATESRLFRLISHADEPHMPFETAKLPDEVIARIKSWIDDGAPYDTPIVEKPGAAVETKSGGSPIVTERDRNFWSFRPLARIDQPVVNNSAWCRTPTDRFVLAKLDAKGIAPNRPAEQRKLIRRATFDLIGLPPKPDEVDAFINDAAPDAYERLIDRLLASPHYGERWGRHWLDLARFAESHGYEQDYDRPHAYHFRDFVIKALNADMPFDQFVRWQIAGDEFEPDNPLAMMATGFLGAGTHATQITANQAEKERYDELDDMAGTIGTALLGLTIGCARCHDHKFDPIPTADYYRLISTFTTAVRSDLDIDLEPAKTRAAHAVWEKAHAPLVAAQERFEREQLPARLDQWLATNPAAPQPRWLIVEPTSMKSSGGATLTKQDDGSILASGTNPSNDSYTFVVRTPLKNITAVRLEALAHPTLAKGGPGRAANGNFSLSDFRVTASSVGEGSRESGVGSRETVAIKLNNPKATFEQSGLPVAAAIDDDKKTAWAIDPQFGKDHAAVFEFEKPIGFEGGIELTFTLQFNNNTMHSIGRPRFSISTTAGPATLDGDAAPHAIVIDAAKALAAPAAERTDEQKNVIANWYKTLDPAWQVVNGRVRDSLKAEPKPALTKVMVTSEGVPAIRLHTQGPDFYDKTYLLKRGDLAQKQDEASQSFLQVLMRTPELEKHWQASPPADCRTSYRRRALANWITDPDAGAGHLLARVIVNRLWQHHLGRGIVATPSDFGHSGERPTHPELLDWLASELVSSGWKLKSLHKLIMTSAVYMQSADTDAARAAVDADNSLYWRRSVRRLEAEVLRDAMLAVSGQLDETMFGSGTLDPNMRRRSIYFFVKRSQLVPMMTLFDAPEPLTGMAARPATTIPPQALALMNNPQIRTFAREFAKRLLPQMTRSPADAVRAAYLTALARPPADDELADAVAFLGEQCGSYRAASKPEATELALADFCQALMSLNEFVFVE